MQVSQASQHSISDVIAEYTEKAGPAAVITTLAWTAIHCTVLLLEAPIALPIGIFVIGGGISLAAIIFQRTVGEENLPKEKSQDFSTEILRTLGGYAALPGAVALAVKVAPIIVAAIPIAVPIGLLFAAVIPFGIAKDFQHRISVDFKDKLELVSIASTACALAWIAIHCTVLLLEAPIALPVGIFVIGGITLAAIVFRKTMGKEDLPEDEGIEVLGELGAGFATLIGAAALTVKAAPIIAAAVPIAIPITLLVTTSIVTHIAKHHIDSLIASMPTQWKKLHYLAEKNDPTSQYILFFRYIQFHYTINDANGAVDANATQAEAIKWLKASAKQNYSEALFVVGQCFLLNEYGFLQNTEKGLKYLKAAKSQGHKDAQYFLGLHYIKDTDINNQEEGKRLLTELAGQNPEDLREEKTITKAQYRLGKLFLKKATPEDIKTGLMWLEKSAKNNAKAHYELFEFYLNGKYEVKKNVKKGFTHLKAAAKGNHESANMILAKVFWGRRRRINKNSNLEKAQKYYRRITIIGSSDDLVARAYNGLGKCYHKQKNYSKAIRKYQRSEALVPTSAKFKYNLGKSYLHAAPPTQDIPRGLEKMREALNLGYKKAIAYLPSKAQ
jgi:TPR repeat protein